MGRMFLDKDIFDTATLRYYELKRKFQERYLNPHAWNNGYGTREYIEAYHDLLIYIEKTEEFGDEDPDLKNEIPVDNEHLVLRYLPLPMEIKEQLNEFVTPRNLKREEKLSRIKMFFENVVKSGMSALEFNEMPDPQFVKIKENKMKIKYDEKKETDQRKVDVRKNAEYEDKIADRDDLLDNRQIIYSKLKKGLYVDSIMRAFKFKVEKYLKKYRKSLSYRQERIWRDKIVITEKAVNRFKREFETRLMTPEKEVVKINPVVEVSNAARAYEVAAENLPEPPGHDVEEIQVKLLELKKFNEKLLDKDEHPRKKVKIKVADAECEVGVTGVHEIVKKKVHKQRIKAAKINIEDVDDTTNIEDEKVVEVKEDYSLDSKVEVEEIGTKVRNENRHEIEVSDVKKCDENYGSKKRIENENMRDNLEYIDAIEAGANKSRVVDKSLDKTNENSEINEMSDDKIDVKNECIENLEDEKEIGQGEEKETEIIDENLDELDAEIDYGCVNLDDNNDEERVDPDNGSNSEYVDVVHKQCLGGDGCDNDVVKSKDALMIVPLLQAILAMMIFSVKTLNEHSLLIARLSDLNQPSMFTPFQSLASFTCLQGACLTQSRSCCTVSAAITGKVDSMSRIASAVMVWFRQVCRTINSIKESLIESFCDLITSDDIVKRIADKKHSRKVMI